MQDYIQSFSKSQNLTISRVLQFFPVEGDDVVKLHKVFQELVSNKSIPSTGVKFMQLANYYQPKVTVANNYINTTLDRYQNDLLNSMQEKNGQQQQQQLFNLLERDQISQSVAQLKGYYISDKKYMHILNEKVDGIGKLLLNKAPLVQSRPGTDQGPVHMPFINPNAQSALLNIQQLHSIKPSSIGNGINTHPPYVPPHMRSQILTNHVWPKSRMLMAIVSKMWKEKQINLQQRTELKVMIIQNDPRMLSFLNDYEVDGDRQKLYANFLSLAKNATK